jgi:MerR family mercuric resistance operon transcriptional regulator
MPGLTIGKFAATEGVSVETVRFYQRRGLLAQPERPGSGFREYTDDDRWRLAFIRRARRLGFTLGEIGDLLGPAAALSAEALSTEALSTEALSTEDIVAAAEVKLEAVGSQIAELTLLQCRLRRLVRVCEHGSSDDCMMLQVGEPAAITSREGTHSHERSQKHSHERSHQRSEEGHR